jgi:outer membrane protein OmpA-like peptidoglycan-associated protein
MKMIRPRSAIATAVLAAGIASCSSTPPRPPEVDESRRRPANSENSVNLQICRGELADAREQVLQARRLAEANSGTLAQVALEQLRRTPDAVAPVQTAAVPGRPGAANVVWMLRFAFNSSKIDASPDELQRVVDGARHAAYVVVKGRTDGVVETAGESTIAQRRMAAIYDVLLKGGVDPQKIALQYQPVGDRIADNQTEEGRAANRRAEVELYAAPPERLAVHAGERLAAADAM